MPATALSRASSALACRFGEDERSLGPGHPHDVLGLLLGRPTDPLRLADGRLPGLVHSLGGLGRGVGQELRGAGRRFPHQSLGLGTGPADQQPRLLRGLLDPAGGLGLACDPGLLVQLGHLPAALVDEPGRLGRALGLQPPGFGDRRLLHRRRLGHGLGHDAGPLGVGLGPELDGRALEARPGLVDDDVGFGPSLGPQPLGLGPRLGEDGFRGGGGLGSDSCRFFAQPVPQPCRLVVPLGFARGQDPHGLGLGVGPDALRRPLRVL